MLQATHITYKASGTALLKNVSATFLPGRLNLVIGPNGAGKSTLIKVLCHLLRPVQGSVLYNGVSVSTIPLAEQAKMRSVLSQNIDLAFPLKVHEVVMMGRYPHFSGRPGEADLTACSQAMQFFNVEEMAGRDYMNLSGGEKQRVHFARVAAQIWHAAATGNRYLLLDEPLTFLDVYYQYQFMHKITTLLQQANLVVVGVVHDLNLAAKFGGHIVLLNKGEVLAEGPPEEVLTVRHIEAAYQLRPVIHTHNGHLHILFE